MSLPASPSALFAALPYDALRRIGAFLKLHLRGAQRHQKEGWVTALAAYWNDPAVATQRVAQLPADARTAYDRLRVAPALPAPLFFAHYGALRTSSTLRAPFSVSEILFLNGLLHASGGGAPHTASRLCALVAPALPQAARLPPLAPSPDHAPTIAGPPEIVHDLVQMLIYLVRHPALRLQHARWLPRTALRAINQQLRTPAPLTPHTTHKQAIPLRTLWFLAAQSRLLYGAKLTSLAWAWAALPPVEQLAVLWQAWLGAGEAAILRHAYHQPDAAWGEAARQRCAAFLARRTTPFMTSELANALLVDETLPVAFFTAHFSTLADVDAAMACLLDTLFTPLHLVAALDDTHHVVTPLGRHLNTTGEASPTLPAWKTGATCQAQWVGSQPDGAEHAAALCLSLPWDASPIIPLTLARYSDAEAPPAAFDPTAFPKDETPVPPSQHGFCFTPASLARAAAHGDGVAALFQALAALDLPLHDAYATRLRAWWEAGDQVTVSWLPILRTRQPAQLAHLAQHPALQPFLAEVISPTTAIWTGDLASLRACLREAGLPAAVDQTPAPQPLAPQPTDVALFWLAGELYQYLGRYLPLPAPLDTAALQTLLAGQSDLQQALLQAQLARLVEHITDLLDALPFMPPPHPTDPAQWRDVIETAITQRHSLQITYFSAGRNLTTRRRVDPYWVEDHRGARFLRAYCHSAGRVLTFRLDRIQALETLK